MRQQYIHIFIEGQKEEQACKPASRVSATAPQNIAKNTAAGRWTNPGPEKNKKDRKEGAREDVAMGSHFSLASALVHQL